MLGRKTTPRGPVGAVLVVLALAPACEEDKPLVLTDSEGRTFTADCDAEGQCTLSQASGDTWPGSERVILRRESRLLGVCAVGQTGVVASPGDCRALICETDKDCPPAHGLPEGACVNGACTEQTQPIDEKDAAMLCLWGSGLGRETPNQIERLSMALNCGTPCDVPAPCRQY